MSAPLVVNTRDGACWTRRTVTEGGVALYALADVCSCPEFVMATLPELAERGIVGSADALPMPVGPAPRSEAERLAKQVVELQHELREAQFDTARARRERDVIRERVSEPYGCAHCGVVQRVHGRRYMTGAGMHGWERPSEEQVKDRMLARRAARRPVGQEPQQPRTVLDRARAVLDARVSKDDLRLVLGNVVDYAAELEQCQKNQADNFEVQAALIRKAEARVAELEALTASATEFRMWEPGYGLYVRRAPGTTGFAVMEARRTDKGRRVWTTAGWQYSALLSDAEMFCWPDAQTAVAEARRIMPSAVADEGLSGPCDCGEGAVHYTTADCPAAQRSAAETGGAQ
ncbi:hypothetical protein ACFFKE_32170 [Streptomyces mutabilis]|uniref:hypothetical protein n=1 Tax=Streptomyces mutabilis TaxID=67332 RepID=UPI00177FD9B7|nr:hypothetical protein [Streptomyces mutabilis]